MKGRRPARRRGTPKEPPPSYPAEDEFYGDPSNWRYPLDTPRRAKIARRFFNMDRSRRKYTKDERAFIDYRINSALREFGIDPEDFLRTVEDGERGPGQTFPADIDPGTLGVGDLLLHFVGERRLQSSIEIPEDEVSVEKSTDEYLVARVRDYIIKADLGSRILAHDCGDWIAWMSKKLLCKHVARVLAMIDQENATNILRDLYANKDKWIFSSKPREVFA